MSVLSLIDRRDQKGIIEGHKIKGRLVLSDCAIQQLGQDPTRICLPGLIMSLNGLKSEIRVAKRCSGTEGVVAKASKNDPGQTGVREYCANTRNWWLSQCCLVMLLRGATEEVDCSLIKIAKLN